MNRWLRSLFARRLAMHGHAKSHDRILAVARQMRVEVGLPPTNALGG